MPVTKILLSSEAYNEVSSALEKTGIKSLDRDNNIVISKDISLKGPIDYRLTQIRRDVLEQVVKVYKAPVDEREMETTDAKHFLNFFDAVFNYVWKGEKINGELKVVEEKPKPTTGKW